MEAMMLQRLSLVAVLSLAVFAIDAAAQKRCAKGVPCGNTCISADKTCRTASAPTAAVAPTPRDRRDVEWKVRIEAARKDVEFVGSIAWEDSAGVQQWPIEWHWWNEFKPVARAVTVNVQAKDLHSILTVTISRGDSVIVRKSGTGVVASVPVAAASK